jgi:hypothetical protein
MEQITSAAIVASLAGFVGSFVPLVMKYIRGRRELRSLDSASLTLRYKKKGEVDDLVLQIQPLPTELSRMSKEDRDLFEVELKRLIEAIEVKAPSIHFEIVGNLSDKPLSAAVPQQEQK